MSGDRSGMGRRRYLALGAAGSLAGMAGCSGVLDSSEPSESGDGTVTEDADGALQVTSIERVGDGRRTVKGAVAVENAGERARVGRVVVELSHTEAEGSVERDRPVLLAAGVERSFVISFRPRFVGGDRSGWPDSGSFEFDARFERVEVYEDYPGLVTLSDPATLGDGATWPGAAYDPGATGYNPGTEAPRSEPTAAWTADAEYAYDASGPVVTGETVLAGRSVRALSVDDATEQWAHDGPARTSKLATGEGLVAFGTSEDFRALELASGEVRWRVSASDIWHGAATVAGGRVYASDGELHAVDAASGEVAWTVEDDGPLEGPRPVGGGVVLAGGDPLRAIDVADGSVRWSASLGGAVTDAAIAYDTVFALTESTVVALDLEAGRTRWFASGPFFAGGLAVDDSAVYAQRERYRIAAIDVENGNDLWVSEIEDGPAGPMAVSNGVLVALSENGTLYGVDTESGETLWTMGVSDSVPGSLAVADGVVYFNEPNGPLRALTDAE